MLLLLLLLAHAWPSKRGKWLTLLVKLLLLLLQLPAHALPQVSMRPFLIPAAATSTCRAPPDLQ
jgi:hypothetical protein